MLSRVRPSSLQIAEKCKRAPWLSLRHREENAATEEGDTTDAYVSIALMGGDEPPAHATEAHALLAWVRATFPADAQFYVQHRVTLTDPRTGEVLGEGTPDLLVRHWVEGDYRLTVVDWKSMGQMWAGYLTPPDLALQQLFYMVAGGLELDAQEGQVILVCFDETRVKPIAGSVIPADLWWPIIDRIEAVPQVDAERPEPMATKGRHCDTCWQRSRCSAYLLPAFEVGQVPAALAPFTGAGQLLTHADALSALEWLEDANGIISKAEKVAKLVKGNLEAYANVHGPISRGGEAWGPIETAPRRSGPTVKELEEMGRPDLIKLGAPGKKYEWRRIPGALHEVTAAPEVAAASPAQLGGALMPPTARKTRGKREIKVVDENGQPLLLPVGEKREP